MQGFGRLSRAMHDARCALTLPLLPEISASSVEPGARVAFEAFADVCGYLRKSGVFGLIRDKKWHGGEGPPCSGGRSKIQARKIQIKM